MKYACEDELNHDKVIEFDTEEEFNKYFDLALKYREVSNSYFLFLCRHNSNAIPYKDKVDKFYDELLSYEKYAIYKTDSINENIKNTKSYSLTKIKFMDPSIKNPCYAEDDPRSRYFYISDNIHDLYLDESNNVCALVFYYNGTGDYILYKKDVNFNSFTVI